jgi:hypothetical protein
MTEKTWSTSQDPDDPLVFADGNPELDGIALGVPAALWTGSGRP